MIEITFDRAYRLLWAVGIEFAAQTQRRLIVRPFVLPTDQQACHVICGAYAASPTMARWVYVGFQDSGEPFGFRTARHAHSFAWPAEAGRVSELTTDLVESIEKHVCSTRAVREYRFVDWRTYKDWSFFEKNVDDDLLALRRLIDEVARERRHIRRRRRRRPGRTAHNILHGLVVKYAPHLLD